MNPNEQVVQRFYTAFAALDYTGMQDCYSEEIVFSDPAFGLLQGPEAGAMWEMLCKNARNFSLRFSNIVSLDDEYTTCHWEAIYTFSATGRRVLNKVKAHMRIREGKITEHTDAFDFWTWSRQALGLPGLLLGWNGLLQNKVHKTARKSLDAFIANRKNRAGLSESEKNNAHKL